MLNRILSNFYEFYSEINPATLTGAIDVVVVEQPNGSFTCSPFHVRFGKLGVLRSREKVVDIEINGEPQDIHMKLGDSGEAFFVEEVPLSDEEEIPDHLATSPIPPSEFKELYVGQVRRKSVDLTYETGQLLELENQVSDFSHRRYTDGHNTDFTSQKREFLSRQIELGNIEDMAACLGSRQNSIALAAKEELICRSIGDAKRDEEPAEVEGEAELQQPAAIEEVAPKVSNATKKRRRKKSVMKKKNNSSGNVGSSSALKKAANLGEAPVNDSGPDSKSSTASASSDVEKMEAPVPPKSMPMSMPIKILHDPEIHFFSDTELTANSISGSRPNTPVQSDTEFEVSQRKVEEEIPGQSWAWGELPTSPSYQTDLQCSGMQDSAQSNEAAQAQRYSMLNHVFSFIKRTKRNRRSGSVEGMYLADLSSGNLDPEVTALYFPNFQTERNTDPDMDCESGNGPSLPLSPGSVEGAKSIDSDYEETNNIDKLLKDISLSLCGWAEFPTEENFIRHVVSYTDLCNNPALLESPNLVVRISDKYYNWKSAAPMITCMLVYRRQLLPTTIEQLASNSSPQDKAQNKQESTQRLSWFIWRRKTASNTESVPKTDIKQSEKAVDSVSSVEDLEVSSTINRELLNEPKEEGYCGSQSSDESDLDKNQSTNKKGVLVPQGSFEKCRKTLRLTSEQIAKLNLKDGANEVEFSVTTAYQGTSRCKCHIYKWKYDDKIVISDIDGTITKSDVLGHILPIVGKDWAQSGVAQLFTKIKNNGYKLLYLSARAIGQAKVTREYLRSIKQGDLSLPEGPLLLNPTSLISAFHREVIEKKPEQFKISCLTDIQNLFPSGSKPFYAGYGNRINDVWAYSAVGIPIVRIFTINHKGELKHEFSQTFQSSYSNMSFFVDQLFPPYREAENEYSQFVYWRDPIPALNDIDENKL